MNSDIDLSALDLPDKEKRILEAAIQISNEKGFSSATTSEIARRAGVAEGTIFRYFKTKKDILHGIILQAIKIVANKVVLSSIEKILRNEEKKDLRTLLKDILMDRLDLAQKFFPMFRVVISEALFHEDIREALYKNVISKMDENIMRLFNDMAKSGQLRTDIEPMIMFRSIIGNFMIFIGQKMLFADNFKLSECDKEIDSIISIIIDGLSPKK
ncbi:MAG TPA: TetR/AcrR family transcriptional regulator [Ruminiclostridium sp.]